MIVKLQTEHHLEFLSLTGGCRGSSESTHVTKCHLVGNLMPGLNYKRHSALIASNMVCPFKMSIYHLAKTII